MTSKSFQSTRVVAIAALLASAADGQATSRVNVDSAGIQTDSWTYGTALSADGQIVAFASHASNLVAGDTNNDLDVFVRDRAAGTTERVSVRTSGKEVNGDSSEPALSADGKFVAFSSISKNLVNGDLNGVSDVFVHDRSTGITERVSVDSTGVEGDAGSSHPSLSSDGRYVAFTSTATNLVASDTNGRADVFVHDRQTGTTERVSVDSAGGEADGNSFEPALSADGSIVVFASEATNLDSNPSYGFIAIFVHDRNSGVTERASVDSAGNTANDYCEYPVISGDGRLVAFSSTANNLVASDDNRIQDVFLHDRVTGVTERVSVDSAGVEGNRDSFSPAISGDGRIVAFSSEASNLVDDDSDEYGSDFIDVFVHDRSSGITVRSSVDSTGVAGNRDSENDGIVNLSLSGDGAVVLFSSTATNLVAGDTNGWDDLFVHEIRLADSSWTNYGSGFAGTLGVPTFTPNGDPDLGATLTLSLANSSGKFTAGLLFIGLQRASIPSAWGGDLLVLPVVTQVIALSPAGTTVSGSVPRDLALCGVAVDFQAIELDAGAAHGISFTPGLELIFGR